MRLMKEKLLLILKTKIIMKIIGINGSPWKDGNTSLIIKVIFKELEKEGISTELIELSDVKIKPCRIAKGDKCFACSNKGNCVFNDNDFDQIFEKIKEAGGIILGSPVYGASITTEMKVFLDRMGISSIFNPETLRHKVGASVSAVRRAGVMEIINMMNNVMPFREMIIVGSNYWNMVYGKDIGDVLNDDEGIANMKNIGQNMACSLKKIINI